MKDVDECRRPRICGDTGSKCQNTIGSYMCTKSCGVGYMFNAIIYTCQDLNECARGTHNCATGMRCENYPGTFRCIREKPCGTGYHVNAYTQECEGLHIICHITSSKIVTVFLFILLDAFEQISTNALSTSTTARGISFVKIRPEATSEHSSLAQINSDVT